MAKRKFRIVRDEYGFFVVQHKKKWWPFWSASEGPTYNDVNCFVTEQRAKQWVGILKLRDKSGPVVWSE